MDDPRLLQPRADLTLFGVFRLAAGHPGRTTIQRVLDNSYIVVYYSPRKDITQAFL